MPHILLVIVRVGRSLPAIETDNRWFTNHWDVGRVQDTTIVTRAANAQDCEAIAQILDEYARVEVLLWRTREDILARIDSFLVACADGVVVGCVAVHSYGNGLYEVRSLAVENQWNGRGIGKLLTIASVDHARAFGGIRIFALTRKVDFFLKVGFVLSDKNFFPQKVWADCASCHKRDRCDETAVHLDL